MGKTRKRFDKDSFADYNYVSGDDFQDQNEKRNKKRFDRALRKGDVSTILELNKEIDHVEDQYDKKELGE